MAVKTFKTELSKGYELVRILEGTFEKGYASADLRSLQTVFVPQKIKENYVRCSVTGLHLSTIGQHKTLRSYAATAVKAIGVYYEEGTPQEDNPMVIIQNKDLKWFALRLFGNLLSVTYIENFDPYDIGDDFNPFDIDADKNTIGGWRYLTVNQYQSTNKRLMSIVDWFLRR